MRAPYASAQEKRMQRRMSLIDIIREKAMSEEGISDADMAGYQQMGNRLKEAYSAQETLDLLAQELANLDRQARNRPAPAPKEDFTPSRANAQRLGYEGPVVDPRPMASMVETPPSAEWTKWNAAKAAADKATGERSLLGAAKQFYLSQTEPDKYGERFSEGDATKTGLMMAAGIPLAPLMSSASPVVAGVQGAAAMLPDYLLGTSDGLDVASAAALEGGAAYGINKLAALLAKRAAPSSALVGEYLPRRGGLRLYQQGQLPNRSPALLAAPDGRVAAGTPAIAGRTQRALPDLRPRPEFLENAPEGLYYTQALDGALAKAAEQVGKISGGRRKYRGKAGKLGPAPTPTYVSNAPDGLYMTPDLEAGLSVAGHDARAMGTPSYEALMRSIAADMDSISHPSRSLRREFKTLSPYGDLVDGIPVQFRSGGRVAK